MTGLPIPFLSDTDDSTPFPPVHTAMQDPNGLLMAGANLNPKRVLSAYQQGIFPWYSEGEPILWWSPDPRCIIWPDDLKISRSLRKVIKKQQFEISNTRQFRSVIEACSGPRDGEDGTWITADMIDTYCALADSGHAESIEVWEENALVGGLYGIAIGRVFVGESMFSHRSNASKIALVALAGSGRFDMIDCQLPTEHLISMGASNIPRNDYLQALRILSGKDGQKFDNTDGKAAKDLLDGF